MDTTKLAPETKETASRIDQYIIEPRCGYGIVSRCWLIARNKETGEYIKETKKRYMRFNNSLEIEKYLAEQAKGEKL